LSDLEKSFSLTTTDSTVEIAVHTRHSVVVITSVKGDEVALHVKCWTSDWQVAGSTPARALLRNNRRQVVHTTVTNHLFHATSKTEVNFVTCDVDNTVFANIAPATDLWKQVS